ncbi:hypothetical protein HanPI659440_Chr02g0036131 [Helianthus annuus]|nr:hypothetical protein HanPI659440_Chr02g0036131 [Helianthus annuus]
MGKWITGFVIGGPKMKDGHVRGPKIKKRGSDKIGYNPWRKRNTNNCTPKKKLKSSDSEDASDSDDSSDSDDADVLLLKKKHHVLVDKVSPMPNSTGYNTGKTKKCAWRNTNNCIPKKKPKSSDSEDVSDSEDDSDSDSDVGALFKKKHRELVDSVSPMSDCLLDGGGGGGGDNGGDSELLVPKPEQCELAENVSPMSDSVCISLLFIYVIQSYDYQLEMGKSGFFYTRNRFLTIPDS